MRALTVAVACAFILLGGAAHADNPTTSAGPGRIICKGASCDLGLGVPAKMHYRIDIAALPAEDKARLGKDCTAAGKPCIVTVTGTEAGDPMKVKAASIKWHN